MTNNHEIKLAKVGELVLVSGCEKPVPTRNFRILQAEKETKTDMMNPVMQRCSCREYAETAVPEELLRQLAAAGMQAPSAKNERPWEFLIVCSDEGKQKLAQASPYAKMCTNASAVIVVLADEARIPKTVRGGCRTSAPAQKTSSFALRSWASERYGWACTRGRIAWMRSARPLHCRIGTFRSQQFRSAIRKSPCARRIASMRRVSAGCAEDAGMNVYLSTAQAKSIVLQLMQIFPEGVSLCDEDGVILSSSDTGRINRTSPLAKQCIEQANSGKPYNERVVDGNVTATPLFFKDVCVGAVLMLGDIEQIKRLTSIAKAVGESVIYQPYLKDTSQVSDIINFEFLSEWLNTPGEYSLDFYRRGLRNGIDVSQEYGVVLLDGIWNQLSAQKAVESILPHSNYYICLGNNSIVLIMRKGYDPSIIKDLSMLFNDVSIATGRTGPNLNEAFVSAQNTMFAGKRLYPESMIYDYRDFEFAYAISGLRQVQFDTKINELFAQPIYDDLVQTLEVFFKESGNQAEVINKLYIHRNTLKYRLDRIQEITGKNPRVFEDLFYLYTAYILHKLKK